MKVWNFFHEAYLTATDWIEAYPKVTFWLIVALIVLGVIF